MPEARSESKGNGGLPNEDIHERSHYLTPFDEWGALALVDPPCDA
jgi:hypothetical protein